MTFLNFLHKFSLKCLAVWKILPTFAPANKKWWCHSSVGRAKDWKSLCPRFDSWWHHLQKRSESSAVGSALRSGRRGRAFESPLSDVFKETLKGFLFYFIYLPKRKCHPNRSDISFYPYYPRISLHKVWQRIIILGMWNGPLKILPFAGWATVPSRCK